MEKELPTVERHALNKISWLLDRADAIDKVLSDAETAPTGDHYNALHSLMAEMRKAVSESKGQSLPANAPLKRYLVIGLLTYGDETRFADSFDAIDALHAEDMACEQYDGLTVAGVVELVNGEMRVVA